MVNGRLEDRMPDGVLLVRCLLGARYHTVRRRPICRHCVNSKDMYVNDKILDPSSTRGQKLCS